MCYITYCQWFYCLFLRREGCLVEVIICYPSTQKGKQELAKRVATAHTQLALKYVTGLNCPVEQKIALIDAVLNQIREDIRKENVGQTPHSPAIK